MTWHSKREFDRPAPAEAFAGRRLWSRLNTLRHTLRFRLMMWNAVVVGLTTVIALFGLRIGVRFALLREIDALLKEDLQEVALAIPDVYSPTSEVLHEELNRKALGHNAHRWYVRFIADDGEEIWASRNTPTPRPGFPNDADFSPATLGEFRVMQYRERNMPAPITIRVGASLSLMHENLTQVDRLVFFVMGGVCLAAPLLGYWLAGRTTGFLRQTIRTTTQLHPDQLQERLPIRGTGDELDQLAQAFNLLLDRIARHLQERRDFLANAAHDLRTPLAAIRSSVEVALSSQRSCDEYQELLDGVIEEGAALETLVNQLLLLSETEAEGLKQRGTRFALDEVVLKAIDMFEAVADAKGVRMLRQQVDHVLVEGNRQHLRQVLNNLLDNAIKFTSAGGQVTVTLRRADERRLAVLEVADTGIGISEAEVPRIFERFFRADNARRRETDHKGSGLGLSICRAVVETHNGRITATSQIGQGTTFVVTLPLAAETTSPAVSEG
jgi:heavy metal sensor kinase